MHLAKVKLKIVNPFAAGRKGEVGGGGRGGRGENCLPFPIGVLPVRQSVPRAR